MNRLPTDALERKQLPVATGVLDYFPDAIVELAHVSFVGNEQHNPGQPLHWAREKSTDQDDTLIRHFMERGTFDKDGLRHTAKLAWRALAMLQLEIEATVQDDSPRRREGDEKGCPGSGGDEGYGYWWSCERPAGHTGKHMAWEKYESRELYDGGEW